MTIKTSMLMIIALTCISAGFSAGGQVIQISSKTFNMVPGETGYVTITLRNDGTIPAYELKAVLSDLENPLNSPDECFLCELYSHSRMICLEYDESCYYNLGDLYGSDTKEFTFSINIPENTPNGYYLIDLWFSYVNSSSIPSEIKRISKQELVYIANEEVRPRITISSVKTNPEFIKPGSVFNITLNLTNTGLTAAKSLNLALISDELTAVNQSSNLFINEIPGSSSKELVLTLAAGKGISTGIKPASLLINYSDGVNNYNSIEDFGIIIGGNASFNMFIQSVNPSTAAGGASILLSIANNGLVPAESVSVIINPNNNLLLNSVNEEFIGDLNPGDFTTAGFSFTPLSNDIDTIFTIKYTDALGNIVEFNETERIIIPETTAQAPVVGGNLTGLIILFSITAVIVFLFLRKKRK